MSKNDKKKIRSILSSKKLNLMPSNVSSIQQLRDNDNQIAKEQIDNQEITITQKMKKNFSVESFNINLRFNSEGRAFNTERLKSNTR